MWLCSKSITSHSHIGKIPFHTQSMDAVFKQAGICFFYKIKTDGILQFTRGDGIFVTSCPRQSLLLQDSLFSTAHLIAVSLQSRSIIYFFLSGHFQSLPALRHPECRMILIPVCVEGVSHSSILNYKQKSSRTLLSKQRK